MGNQRYAFHDLLREVQAEEIREQEPKKWKYYHKRAFDYLVKVEPLSPDRYYHALAYNEEQGLLDWRQAILETYTNSAFERRGALLQSARDQILKLTITSAAEVNYEQGKYYHGKAFRINLLDFIGEIQQGTSYFQSLLQMLLNMHNQLKTQHNIKFFNQSDIVKDVIGETKLSLLMQQLGAAISDLPEDDQEKVLDQLEEEIESKMDLIDDELGEKPNIFRDSFSKLSQILTTNYMQEGENSSIIKEINESVIEVPTIFSKGPEVMLDQLKNMLQSMAVPFPYEQKIYDSKNIDYSKVQNFVSSTSSLFSVLASYIKFPYINENTADDFSNIFEELKTKTRDAYKELLDSSIIDSDQFNFIKIMAGEMINLFDSIKNPYTLFSTNSESINKGIESDLENLSKAFYSGLNIIEYLQKDLNFKEINLLNNKDVVKSIEDSEYFNQSMQSAILSYQNALDQFRQVGDHSGEAKCYLAQGDILLEKGELLNAITLYSNANQLYQQIQDIYGQMYSLFCRSVVYEQIDETQLALKDAETSYQMALLLNFPFKDFIRSHLIKLNEGKTFSQ